MALQPQTRGLGAPSTESGTQPPQAKRWTSENRNKAIAIRDAKANGRSASDGLRDYLASSDQKDSGSSGDMGSMSSGSMSASSSLTGGSSMSGDTSYRGLGGTGVEIADIAAKIMDSNSPLMQRADAKGRAYANSRGMLNSSMAGEASQAASLDYVVPMAQTERTERGTDRRFDKQIAFDTEQNKLQREHEFEINEQKFGYDQALQMDAQKWQSGENALDREFDLTLQKDQQGFVGGENQRDRDLTSSEGEKDRTFTSYEAQRDRDFQSIEADLDRTFTGSENQLDRENSLALAESEQDFRLNLSDKEYEQLLGITKVEFGNLLKLTDIEFENAMKMTKEEFKNNLDLLAKEQDFSSEERQKDRDFEAYMQEQGFDFTSMENQLDRENSTALAEMEQDFRLNLSDQEYEQALGITKQEFQNLLELTDVEFENTLKMTKEELGNALAVLKQEQDFTANENLLGRIFTSEENTKAFDRQVYITELQLASNEFLAELDKETREALADQDAELKLKLANLELDDAQLQALGAEISGYHAQYQDAFRTILSNPDLDADERNSLMRSFGDMLSNQIDGAASLYDVDVSWNGDGTFDPVEGNVDPTAPEPESPTSNNGGNAQTAAWANKSQSQRFAEWQANRNSDSESMNDYIQRMGYA